MACVYLLVSIYEHFILSDIQCFTLALANLPWLERFLTGEKLLIRTRHHGEMSYLIIIVEYYASSWSPEPRFEYLHHSRF